MAFKVWLTALFALVAVTAPRASAAPPSAAAFAQPDAYSSIAIAPGGHRFAVMTQKDSRYVVRAYDIDHPDRPLGEQILGPAVEGLWVTWKSDDYIVFSVRLPDHNLGFLVGQTRMLVADPKFSHVFNLNPPPHKPGGSDPRNREVPQYQDQITSLLPDDPFHIENQIDWLSSNAPNLQKIDVRNAAATQVMEHNTAVISWFADRDGAPRLAFGDTVRGRPTLYKVGGRGELTPLNPPSDQALAVFDPQGFDGDPDRLAVISNHENGLAGLYVFSLSKNAFIEKLYAADGYDVSRAIFSPDGRRVVGAGFTTETSQQAYFDKAEIERSAAMRALVGRPFQRLSQSLDGRYVIVAALEDGRPAETLWLDTQAGVAKSLGRIAPALDGVVFGKSVPVRFQAADGLPIPGYVILPPGYADLASARNLPFVVMPHGGPESRDTADFDWWAQFVATRGYGVLQVNFRGSTGYGEAFRAAGERQWGKGIQTDVEDGARWLVSQGLADPQRMCVAGWSFGGYVALVSAVRDAALFKCASATAGVADLISMIDHESNFYGGDIATRRLIGAASRDRASLVDASPSLHADRIAMPVMLTHGTADLQVPVEQSQLMRDKLRAAGKAFDYQELELANHSLSREKDRLAFLTRLEAFLAKNIGPGSAPAH